MPLLRRRRPMLRAAAVGAGAYHMGKRREQSREDQQQAPAQSPAPSGGGLAPDSMDQLERLGKLHEQGVLTDQEFEQQKSKVLAS